MNKRQLMKTIQLYPSYYWMSEQHLHPKRHCSLKGELKQDSLKQLSLNVSGSVLEKHKFE